MKFYNGRAYLHYMKNVRVTSFAFLKSRLFNVWGLEIFQDSLSGWLYMPLMRTLFGKGYASV